MLEAPLQPIDPLVQTLEAMIDRIEAMIDPIEAMIDRIGPDAFLEQVRSALAYLLFEEHRSLEQRLTDLIDGQASPAVKGVREAILTKVLAAAWPDRIFPALVYDSEEGAGKRQLAHALLGLSLPARDGSDWTIGRLAI